MHQFRDALRFAQAEFSARLGVSTNTVARWERGEILPPKLAELAAGYVYMMRWGYRSVCCDRLSASSEGRLRNVFYLEWKTKEGRFNLYSPYPLDGCVSSNNDPWRQYGGISICLHYRCSNRFFSPNDAMGDRNTCGVRFSPIPKGGLTIFLWSISGTRGIDMSWWLQSFEKYWDFNGRSRRTEYWMFFLLLLTFLGWQPVW